jgi:hypothetical protein
MGIAPGGPVEVIAADLVPFSAHRRSWMRGHSGSEASRRLGGGHTYRGRGVFPTSAGWQGGPARRGPPAERSRETAAGPAGEYMGTGAIGVGVPPLAPRGVVCDVASGSGRLRWKLTAAKATSPRASPAETLPRECIAAAGEGSGAKRALSYQSTILWVDDRLRGGGSRPAAMEGAGPSVVGDRGCGASVVGNPDRTARERAPGRGSRDGWQTRNVAVSKLGAAAVPTCQFAGTSVFASAGNLRNGRCRKGAPRGGKLVDIAVRIARAAAAGLRITLGITAVDLRVCGVGRSDVDTISAVCAA